MASVMGLASHCGSDLGMVVAESFVVQVLWVVVQYAVQILDKARSCFKCYGLCFKLRFKSEIRLLFQMLRVVVQVAVHMWVMSF